MLSVYLACHFHFLETLFKFKRIQYGYYLSCEWESYTVESKVIENLKGD